MPAAQPPAHPGTADGDAERALHEALGALMAPLARLCVARGLPFAAAENLMKQAFVQAASQAHPGLLPHRKVSRIATVTGINRREVTRLVQAAEEAPAPVRSPASEVFARWVTDSAYRRRDGQPRTLPRTGAEPSFETLAQSVTRDVHPRSLLDELIRLGMARLADDDTVSLAQESFVPSGDLVRMLGFVGRNVGDHLDAAVHNALHNDRRHFEQALFAHGVPLSALPELREQVRAQWQQLVQPLVQRLQALIDGADADAPTGRLRIGMYTFDDGNADDPAPSPTPARRLRRDPPKS